MKKSFWSLWRFTAFLVIGLMFPSGLALAQQPIAEVENLGDTLVFHPFVSFAQLILTVSGPCDFQFRQVVTEGEPFFRLDATTIDGVYTYHLMREETIDPDIVKILQEARQANDPEVSRALCRDGKLPGPPIAQSEGFQVFEGRIIYDPSLVEKGGLRSPEPTLDSLSAPVIQSLAAPDFVIIDDLIVDGSACIGFDCVNGESFGFDTVRLKENNLRIKFDDTSTAASFPRNDWQLTANDSANGGASKFSIDDISGSRTPFTVEANARSHSLYVDDGGRIGSRTSTPSTEIHTIDGDTPTLRLQQDGSSGFAPQTWDVAGNETNFFIRDVTNGSALPFRIRPSAPTSAIDISATGNVGMGTASPTEALHVTRTSDSVRVLLDAGGNNSTVRLQANNSRDWLFGLSNMNTEFVINNLNNGGEEVIISDVGDITANGMLLTSDRNAKTNIEPQDGQDILAILSELPIATWSFKSNPDERHLGPMAQDFYAAFGLGRDERTISPLDASSVAMAAIQGLSQVVEELRQENADLTARLLALEATAGNQE